VVAPEELRAQLGSRLLVRSSAWPINASDLAATMFEAVGGLARSVWASADVARVYGDGGVLPVGVEMVGHPVPSQ
jgi:hypothetical protein